MKRRLPWQLQLDSFKLCLKCEVSSVAGPYPCVPKKPRVRAIVYIVFGVSWEPLAKNRVFNACNRGFCQIVYDSWGKYHPTLYNYI